MGVAIRRTIIDHNTTCRYSYRSFCSCMENMLLVACGLGLQRECLGRIVGLTLGLLTGVYQQAVAFLGYREIIERARRRTALHFAFAIVEGAVAGAMELIL